MRDSSHKLHTVTVSIVGQLMSIGFPLFFPLLLHWSFHGIPVDFLSTQLLLQDLHIALGPLGAEDDGMKNNGCANKNPESYI